MFSPLAQGTANWDGGLQFEELSNQSSPVVPLLPQLLIHHSPHGSKSARSNVSFAASSDGQITLPKTFVTRKGAIVLFTPSGELLNHANDENYLKKENVHQLGVKLGTLGNLTHSVLEFGKEDEEAWEGIPGIPGSSRESKVNEGKQQRNKPAFLRFLHYLDLENLTADKHVQPGADPDYYLGELRKFSGHPTFRRFRSQTPFSTRTSHSNTYSHFLEDDEEITSIIREQVKCVRTEWCHSKGHINHAGVVESDHIADGLDVPEGFSSFSSPRVHRGPATKSSFHPSMPTSTHSSSAREAIGESMSRPKTAPIPPTLESPKANPRITSARPPPIPRALGTAPNHLAEILSADVGFGRYHRKGSSPRLRFVSSPSPSVYPESSRDATPDLTKPPHLAGFEEKGEVWSRAANVIEEEDEAWIPGDQWVAVNVRRPSSAGGSLESGREETEVNVQRRASSAGAASRTSRASLHSSRSGSTSSLSRQNIRSVSVASRHVYHTDPSQSENFDGTGREQPSSPDWSAIGEELMTTRRHQSGADIKRESLWEPATVGDDARKTPPFVNRVASPSQVPSPSVTSRLTSPSTRSPSANSLRLNTAGSRVSSASSSEMSIQWAEAAERAAARVSSASSRSEMVASAQSGKQQEMRDEKELRTSSAGSTKKGGESGATQGSEANLAQVSETVVRSQSVADGVYEDAMNVNDVEFATEWPGATVQQGEGALGPPSEGRDVEDDTTPELLSSVAPTEEPSSRSPPTVFIVNMEKCSDTASTRPADPREFTLDIVDDGPNLQEEEEVSSIQSTPRILEKDAVGEKENVTSMRTPSVETLTHLAPSNRDTADADRRSTDSFVHPSLVESSLDVRDGSPEGPKQNVLDVLCVKSPTPLKANDILHTELLPSMALETEGKVEGRQSPTAYKETINIEKSRPSSPVSEEQRNIPVSVGEAVLKYIESGQEPQVRERTSRSRRNSETATEETVKAPKVEDETASLQKNKGESRPRAETPKTPMSKASEPASSSLRPKSKASNAGKSRPEPKPDFPGLSFLKGEETTAKMAQPSDEEREVRRQMVSGLLTKPDGPKAGKLELEGIGKDGEEGKSASGGLVARARHSMDDTKRDLSDLVALLPKNKTPNKKEKKVEAKKKSAKVSKPSKKKDEPLDPRNIDFDAFNTPEMLNEMDQELRQFVLEQGASDDASCVVTQPSVATAGERDVKRNDSVQTLEVPQFAPDVPAERRDAHAPSKPKKLSKKELTKMRSDQRKEERKRKEEEKRKNEEEARLLKEREEKAAKAKAEAEERQRSIEEEKLRRLLEEDEARREEEEALERLKDAKKKAREEREARRAAEAERRKLEVQKKREEKKKREEELREREKELEQQKMDRERRKAEIDEARRRREEMERLEEEQWREEERLRALQEEEEQRRLEEEQIREAEAELQRLQEEREYREQMRRIAENQEAKLRQEEEKRLRREEEELRKIEEENRKREEAEQERKREEQRRTEMARRLEALARMRSVQAAAQRKAFLLKRREQNVERMQNLKSTRNGQHITRAYTFTYFIHIPRRVWEVPIGFNKKKKAYKPVRRKAPEPTPE